MSKTREIQNKILIELAEKKSPLTLYLMNGFQMRGSLIAFDDYVLVIDVDGRQQMIYKHAVSTLTPHYTFDIVN